MTDQDNSAQVAEETPSTPTTEPVQATDTEAGQEIPEWVRNDPEAAYKALQDARREAADNRAKLKAEQDKANQEAEERRVARMNAIEKEKDRADKAEQRAQEAEQRVVTAERRALLTGKVVDLDAALELIKPEHLDASGALNLDAFLEARPFLKVPEAQDPSPSPLRGMNSRTVPQSPTSSFNETLRRRAGR